MQVSFCLGVALLASHCSSDPTELIVVVRTDLRVPGEIDAVRFDVIGPTGKSSVVRQPLIGADAPSFPLTLTVVPANPGSLLIRVFGELQEDDIVVQERLVLPTAGARQSVEVFLGRSCIPLALGCGERRTCVDGACASARVEPGPWPLTEDAGPVGDGGQEMDSDTQDARVRDSGVHDADDAMADAVASDGPFDCPDGCDDGDDCTDDVCTEFGCQHVGQCECAVDGDCPADVYESWGACDYATECAVEGERTRMVTRYSCGDRECVAFQETENESCDRLTDGMSCSESTGSWSGCAILAGSAGSCAPMGERRRDHVGGECQAGACAEIQTTPEVEACSPNTEGWYCWGCGNEESCACSGGACVVETPVPIYSAETLGPTITVTCIATGDTCVGISTRQKGGSLCNLRCAGPVRVKCEGSTPTEVQHYVSRVWRAVCSSMETSPDMHEAECDVDGGADEWVQVRCGLFDGG